ncbi:GNAT family N-acetyltransferase [Methylophaga thiooxydans]|uniref:GNAT family N-acetyltransferase n=1 Tax=Methylophaga thiooxydans TaxID=392484 RepID=UPI0023579AB8|nr:GNAT family N-acetyltransferase [Methylophaga thiooxydans]
MEIRAFDSDLLVPLRQLYLETRLATFVWLDCSGFTLTDFDRDTEGERIWVAMDSGRVVGFLSVWEPANFIHHLYVCTDSLRTGIGTKLLDACKSTHAELSLKCLAQNQQAISFYKSSGFEIHSAEGSGLERYYLMQYSIGIKPKLCV